MSKAFIATTIWVCTIILMSACEQQTKKYNRIGKKLYTMQELAHKTFHLDDSTTQVLEYVQTYIEHDSLKLALYNKPVKNICIFDVKSGKAINKIQLHKEGPHAINNNIMGFLYINRDSTYLYDYWSRKLLLVNHKGEIVNTDELASMLLPNSDDNIVKAYPLPTTSTPICKVGDNIILQGESGKRLESMTTTEEFVTALYNIKKKTIKFANTYTPVYGDLKTNAWHTFGYLVVPYCLNNKQEMAISFPADDSISIYNIDADQIKRYFAGYSTAKTSKPAGANTMGEIAKHYWSQTQYTGIYYDKWNNLYYRIVAQPTSDYNINSKKNPVKDLSIVILDTYYNKVGEYDVKESTNLFTHTFVSPEGLHINVLSDDDDYLTFLTLKPVKL